MNESYYISHGGPGSGRYPWGSGDRPYQRLEKAKQHRGIMGYIKAKKVQEAEEEKQKAMMEIRKKAEDFVKKEEEFQLNKVKVLSSGSASDVLKYKGMLTNEELREAYTRIDWERRLSSFAADEIQTNMKKIDKIMEDLKTVNKWGSIMTDSYNLMADVYNSTKAGKIDPWPEIRKGVTRAEKNKK